MKLRVSDVYLGDSVRLRTTIIQQKIGRPCHSSLLTDSTREALVAWLTKRSLRSGDWLFPSRSHAGDHVTTRQYTRAAFAWIAMQLSHLVVTATAKAFSSFVLRSSAPLPFCPALNALSCCASGLLTEVGLNDDNVGIILDDPVTSLDHERKELIAKRLVAAAAGRQVVVFTHDMVFFAKLADAADKAKADITTHWMQRSGDNKPGQAV